MCFIASIFKVKQDESSIFPITKMLLDEQNTNNDGTGSYCFNKNNDNVYNQKKMKEDAKSIAINLSKFDVINYHFRNSTGGEVNEKNAHFWKIGNWIFAHNGTASSFSDAKKADSLVFFEEIINRKFLRPSGFINIEKIKEFSNENNLYGRFIIINSVTKKMYFFGDFQTYLLNNAYLIVTSAKADFESFKQVLGISFPVENQLEISETEIDGIISFDFKNGFLQLEEKFKEFGFNKVEKKDDKPQSLDDDMNRSEKEWLQSQGFSNTNEYQEEFEKIESYYTKKMKELKADPSPENIKKLEEMEIDYEITLQELDEMYFGYGLNNKMRTDLMLTK